MELTQDEILDAWERAEEGTLKWAPDRSAVRGRFTAAEKSRLSQAMDKLVAHTGHADRWAWRAATGRGAPLKRTLLTLSTLVPHRTPHALYDWLRRTYLRARLSAEQLEAVRSAPDGSAAALAKQLKACKASVEIELRKCKRGLEREPTGIKRGRRYKMNGGSPRASAGSVAGTPRQSEGGVGTPRMSQASAAGATAVVDGTPRENPIYTLSINDWILLLCNCMQVEPTPDACRKCGASTVLPFALASGEASVPEAAVAARAGVPRSTAASFLARTLLPYVLLRWTRARVRRTLLGAAARAARSDDAWTRAPLWRCFRRGAVRTLLIRTADLMHKDRGRAVAKLAKQATDPDPSELLNEMATGGLICHACFVRQTGPTSPIHVLPQINQMRP